MKRIISLIILSSVFGGWLNAQVVVSDPTNYAAALENILSREKDNALSLKNDGIKIVEARQTSQAMLTMVKMYCNVQPWIKKSPEILDAVDCYVTVFNAMLIFTQRAAALDYSNLPLVLSYVNYGWAVVSLMYTNTLEFVDLLNPSNNLSQAERKAGIHSASARIQRLTCQFYNYMSAVSRINRQSYMLGIHTGEMVSLLGGSWEGGSSGKYATDLWSRKYSGWAWL